ncbi:MAG: glycosyltransferase [candidate division Zixibacteria bacterium]|nr:glycosyltransferase [candidate division Zixibacteria bacterium]
MSSKPRVSIGLPVYNGAAYLRETIESILNQTYTDFELVISNNASTDETDSICREYAFGDNRIRYYSYGKNSGAAWNYNNVFYLSRGKYFKWGAHDDICAPENIEQCVKALDENPQAVLSYPKSDLIDEHGLEIEVGKEDLYLSSSDIRDRFAKCLDPMPLYHNPVFGLTRREVLAKTRLIEPYLASDRCLMAELSLHGTFHEIPEVLFYRRKRPGNIGTSPEDLEFYNPSLKGKIVFPEWRVFLEHMKSVWKTRIPQGSKILLWWDVIKWALRKRKIMLWQIKLAVKTFYYKQFSSGGVRRSAGSKYMVDELKRQKS